MQKKMQSRSASAISRAGDYEVIDGDVTTARAHVVRVWGAAVGWPGRQRDFYSSYYLDPSIERPRLKLLRHVPSGRIVGTLGISPRRVMRHGREIRAAAFSHLCVEKAHRNVQPAKLLLAAALDTCRGNFELAYAMPRTRASNAFARLVGSMGWRLACNGSRCVRVLRYATYAGRFLPHPLAVAAAAGVNVVARMRDAFRGRADRVVAKWTDRVDPRMSALWSTALPHNGWAAVRDDATLRWRFDGVVSFHRRYLLLHEPGADMLEAWFVCDDHPADSNVLVVQDFWGRHATNAIGQAAIRTLCREVRALGYSSVEMRLAAPQECFVPWRAEGFVQRNKGDTYVCWLDLL